MTEQEMWRNLDFSVMKLDMVPFVLVQQCMKKTKNKIGSIEYLKHVLDIIMAQCNDGFTMCVCAPFYWKEKLQYFG